MSTIYSTGDEDLWVLGWLSSLCVSSAVYHSKHYVLFCCKVWTFLLQYWLKIFFQIKFCWSLQPFDLLFMFRPTSHANPCRRYSHERVNTVFICFFFFFTLFFQNETDTYSGVNIDLKVVKPKNIKLKNFL